MDNSLRREKRLDKNGKLVTRLVRDGEQPDTKAQKLPAPSPAQSTVQPPYAFQKTQNVYTYSKNSFRPSSDLMIAVRFNDGSREAPYSFVATEAEVYDVLSVVDADNAVYLLAAGLSSSKIVTKVLTSCGLSSLIRDNAEHTTEALQSGISSRSVFRLFDREFVDDVKPMNSYMVRKAQAMDDNFLNASHVKEAISQGVVSDSTVQAVGVRPVYRLVSTCPDLFRNVEDKKYTSTELAKWISRWNLDTEDGKQSARQVAVVGALDGGLLDSIPSTACLMSVSQAITAAEQMRGYDVEQQQQLGWHVRDIYAKDIAPYSFNDHFDFFERGVTPQEVLSGAESNMTAQQILAHHEGIDKPLVGGWL